MLLFGRKSGSSVAIVALNKATTASTLSGSVSALGLADGTVLHDRLGGPDVTVSGGAVNLTLGARGAAVLAP
jgi:hypothetical protein